MSRHHQVTGAPESKRLQVISLDGSKPLLFYCCPFLSFMLFCYIRKRMTYFSCSDEAEFHPNVGRSVLPWLDWNPSARRRF